MSSFSILPWIFFLIYPTPAHSVKTVVNNVIIQKCEFGVINLTCYLSGLPIDDAPELANFIQFMHYKLVMTDF